MCTCQTKNFGLSSLLASICPSLRPSVSPSLSLLSLNHHFCRRPSSIPQPFGLCKFCVFFSVSLRACLCPSRCIFSCLFLCLILSLSLVRLQPLSSAPVSTPSSSVAVWFVGSVIYPIALISV